MIALGVRRHLLERLAGGLGEGPVQALARLQHLLRFDADVRRLASHAALRLMDEKARVGKAEAVLPRHRHVDVGAGARHPSCADHLHSGLHETDHVVQRVARLHMPSLGVDEDGDVVVGARSHGEQLGAHLLRQPRSHFAEDENGARLEQTLGDLGAEQRAPGRKLFFTGHRISSARRGGVAAGW